MKYYNDFNGNNEMLLIIFHCFIIYFSIKIQFIPKSLLLSYMIDINCISSLFFNFINTSVYVQMCRNIIQYIIYTLSPSCIYFSIKRRDWISSGVIYKRTTIKPGWMGTVSCVFDFSILHILTTRVCNLFHRVDRILRLSYTLDELK